MLMTSRARPTTAFCRHIHWHTRRLFTNEKGCATVTTADGWNHGHIALVSLKIALLLQSANRSTRDSILQSVCIEGVCSSLDPLDRDNGKIFQLGKTNAPLWSSNQNIFLVVILCHIKLTKQCNSNFHSLSLLSMRYSHTLLLSKI